MQTNREKISKIRSLHPIHSNRTWHYLVVDDHEAIRDGITATLSLLFPEVLQCVGEASDFQTATHLADTEHPDFIILDLHLGKTELDGIEMVRRLKRCYPNIALLVLTQEENPYCLAEISKLGVEAILIKNRFQKKMWDDVLSAVKKGGHFIQPEMAQAILTACAHNVEKQLRSRPYQVLRLRRDYSVSEIAEQLNLSKPTIYGYLQAAQRQLGAHSLPDAFRKLDQRLSLSD